MHQAGYNGTVGVPLSHKEGTGKDAYWTVQSKQHCEMHSGPLLLVSASSAPVTLRSMNSMMDKHTDTFPGL